MTDWISEYRVGEWRAAKDRSVTKSQPDQEIPWVSQGSILQMGNILLALPDGWLLMSRAETSDLIWVRKELVKQ